MKTLFTISILFFSGFVYSQRTVDVDKVDGLPVNAFYTVSGNPMTTMRFVRLKQGTPFFRDSWMKALVMTEQGKSYRSEKAKLNLLDNELHFLNPKGEEYICSLPLREVLLTDTVSGAAHHFVHSTGTPALAGQKNAGWYLRLVSGKASLYQFFSKKLQEAKNYGSSVADQFIYTNEEFLVVYNGAVSKVKKPREVVALLADGQTELEAFLKTNDAKKGTVADQMTALVNFYNGLQ